MLCGKTAIISKMTELGAVAKPFLLVVDDELDVANLVSEFFENEGFRVTTAPDGWQAVVQTEGLKLDLLICDIMMPGPKGSGFDAYAGIRSSPYVRKNLPILFLTAMPLDKVRATLPPDPQVRIMGKPISLPALRAAVKELIGR